MHDDLDLRVIERHHDADPRYRAELRRRVEAILDGTEELPADEHAVEPIPIGLTVQRSTRPGQRRWYALGAATLVGAAAAIAGIVVVASGGDAHSPALDPAPVPPSTVSAPPPTSPALTPSGGMWPQSSIEEVRAAQKRADAGDPDYTWQVGALTAPEEPFAHVELEIVDRFIRNVLGWEAYRFDEINSGVATGQDAEGWPDTGLNDQRYLRCATSGTNRLYPDEPCAPTLDDRTYESVSIDLAQLDRTTRDGIWVVSTWHMTAPFVQVDPAPVEARARERLDAFLAARIAGSGAEGYVAVPGHPEVPLLYATAAGAPYERYEIDHIDGPWWPSGNGVFSVRLFAKGDAIVVQQQIRWGQSGELLPLDPSGTTENGQPIVLWSTSSDGDVTVSAPNTWGVYWAAPDSEVWFGQLTHPGGESIGLVDPVAYDAWCAKYDGSPLLSAPADAAAIAQQVIADPNFVTTTPVTARIGGVDAVSIDVTLAPGGKPCGIYVTDIARWIHELQPGSRLRLYLVDLPEGMSVKTLAITVLAPADRFEAVIAETAPILESIEFHPN